MIGGEIFIIGKEENAIPWDRLNSVQRKDLLLFEFQDYSYRKYQYEYFIENINDLINEKQVNELWKEMIRLGSAETISLLIERGSIVPIVSDAVIVYRDQSNIKRYQVSSVTGLRDKILMTPVTANYTNTLKPYVNERGVLVKVKLPRVVIREAELNDKYVFPRIAVENEFITITGFIIDNSKRWLLHRYNIKENISLFPTIPGPRTRTILLDHTKPATSWINKLNNWLIEEADATYLRKVYDQPRFDLALIESWNEKMAKNKEIKDQLPEIIVEWRERTFPSWLTVNPTLIISRIYGKYVPIGTLADTTIQRSMWLSKNYFGAIPFYVFFTLVRLLAKTELSEMEEVYNQSYKHLEDLMNDNKVNKKLLHAQCNPEEESCNDETITVKAVFIKHLVEELKRYLTQNGLYHAFNDNLLKADKEERQLSIKTDLYYQAISSQYSNAFLDEKKQIANEAYLPIWKVLSDEEDKIVNKWITEMKELHAPYNQDRIKFDELTVLEDKYNLLKEMLSKCPKVTEDPETRSIVCQEPKGRTYVLGCKHEVLMMEQYMDKTKAEEIQKVLENEYYADQDPESEIVYCQYCGRKIKDTELKQQVIWEDNIRVFGNIVKRENDIDSDIKNIINRVLAFTGLQSSIDFFVILKNISPLIEARLAEINRLNLGTEEQIIYKKIEIISYVYAGIFNEIIKSNFKINFRKEFFSPGGNERSFDSLLLIALKTIHRTDPLLINNPLKLSVRRIIIHAYEIIRSNEFNKDSEVYREIFNEMKNVKVLLRIYGHGKRGGEGGGIKNLKDIEQVTDYLSNLFVKRLKELASLKKVPFLNDKWTEFVNEDSINELNFILYYGLFHKTINWVQLRKFWPNRGIHWLDLHKYMSEFDYYSSDRFCSNGSTRKKIKVVFPQNEEFNMGEYKDKLKGQKQAFDMGASLADIPDYFRISDKINAGNVTNFTRKYIENCDGDSGNGEKIKKIVLAKVKEERLKNASTLICAGLVGQEIYLGHTFVCGREFTDFESLDKILTAQDVSEKVWTIESAPINEFKLPIEFKGLTILDRRVIVELITKIAKYHITDFKKDELMNQISSIGQFTRVFKEQLQDPDEKKIFKNQNYSRFNDIMNVVKRLEANFLFVKAHDLDVFITSPSSEYLRKFINEKSEADFKATLPDYYNLNNYYDLQYTREIGTTKKIAVAMNILVLIATQIVETKLDAEFIIAFFNQAIKDQNVIDTSKEDINFIDEKYDMDKRKRFENLYRLTPEEKIERQLMNINFMENQDVFQELLEEEQEQMDKMRADAYDPAHEVQQENDNDQEIEISRDDDAIYDAGAFDYI